MLSLQEQLVEVRPPYVRSPKKRVPANREPQVDKLVTDRRREAALVSNSDGMRRLASSEAKLSKRTRSAEETSHEED